MHGLAIVAGWVLFFWGWHRVLAATPDFSELRVLMIGAAIVVPVVTVSWILHNRGIHRRKGPRRSITPATLAYAADFNGRAIVADFRSLARAQRVWIVSDGERKLYLQEPAAVASGSPRTAQAHEAADAAPPPPAAREAPAASTLKHRTADAGAGSSPAAAADASRPVAAADAGETTNERDTRSQR